MLAETIKVDKSTARKIEDSMDDQFDLNSDDYSVGTKNYRKVTKRATKYSTQNVIDEHDEILDDPVQH